MRSKFILIILIFAVPMILSFTLYQFRNSFHFKTMNHGEFVQPALSMQKLGLQDSAAKTWKILFVTPDNCNEQTNEILHTLHQLKKALGKNQNRVSLLLLKKENCKLTEEFEFHRQSFTAAQFKNYQKEIELREINPWNAIFLIDPIGNIFMYFPGDANKMNILKDLKRALEVSQIG